MRHKHFILCVLLLSGLGLTGLQAQTASTATGAQATGSGGSVSYSVGQVADQTHTGTGGSVAEGVQQPYEISVVTAIQEATGINLSVTAFPNPTIDHLTLSIDPSTALSIQSMSYLLYDMNGRILQNGEITGYQTSIDMSELLPANYFVKVIQGNKEIKSFKIMKR